jgi:hypothetical protein
MEQCRGDSGDRGSSGAGHCGAALPGAPAAAADGVRSESLTRGGPRRESKRIENCPLIRSEIAGGVSGLITVRSRHTGVIVREQGVQATEVPYAGHTSPFHRLRNSRCGDVPHFGLASQPAERAVWLC